MKRFAILFMVLKVPVDICALFLACITAYILRSMDWALSLRPILFDLTLSEFLFLALFPLGVWILLFAFLGLYSSDPNRKFSGDIKRVILGSLTTLGIVALYLLFTLTQFDSRFLILMTFGLGILFVIIGRFILRGVQGVLFRFGIGLRRAVLVGTGEYVDELKEALLREPKYGYKIVRTVRNIAEAEKEFLLKKNSKIDEIIFAKTSSNQEEALGLIEFCNENHITFKYIADLFATYSTNISVSPLAGVPVIELKKTKLEGWGKVLKRCMDIIVSIFILIVLSPFILLVSCIILLETGHPVFYKNERVGIQGKSFFALKFRSMFKERSTGSQFGKSGEKALLEEEKLIKKQNTRKGPIYKIAHDPRVTSFGRFIRRWSIDELPQFVNVLMGSMSIVGPRPHQPREVSQYKKGHKRVLYIKPGITGLSQISGRSDLSYDEEMKLDIFYIENWSPFLDFIIFIKTPFILLRKRKVE